MLGGTMPRGGFGGTQVFGSSKMSTATQNAMANLRVTHVSNAREFEDFRRIPKFNKAPLAVIHPSPTKKRPQPRKAAFNAELEGSPAAISKERPKRRFDIPEELTRPHVESGSPSRKQIGRRTSTSNASKFSNKGRGGAAN